MARLPFAPLLAGAALMMATGAWGQQLTTVRVASGLSRPVFAASPPGDRSRLFIVEQRGSAGIETRADIRILNLTTRTLNPVPFLTIHGVATASEQGLLGMAFDPGFATNGFVYVNFTNIAGDTRIVRYRVSADPGVADPASAATVLSIDQPADNHNGGWLGFGPDGFLYVATGDGGGACDVSGAAADLNSLLGKILRIDVSSLPYSIPPTNPFVGQPVRGEVWAYGLRNPWRCSFDRANGDLYIADVGQQVQEEINVGAIGVGGRNYGWNCREGLVCSTGSGCNTPPICPGCILNGAVDPIRVYTHTDGCSITGGYVYRGAAMPWLRGTYFFADFCSGKIWSLRYGGQPVATIVERTQELAVTGLFIDQISSFAEDTAGELYIVDQGGGEIYRIAPRCYANCDGSNAAPVLSVNDFMCFFNRFNAGDPYANCDRSAGGIHPLNIFDFLCFQQAYTAGCP